MVETTPNPEPPERPFRSWIGFWLQFAILALIFALGAIAASGDQAPGDYGCGLTVILGALVLAFLRLKRRFDGGSAGWRDFLLVTTMGSLTVVIPLFTVIGVIGLFVARDAPHGSLHGAGLGLFVVSGVVIFLDIKHVFDRMNSRSP